ncbi:hypothetical protein OSB04_016135 [Centaurea solstitialis]|uniref:Uncharacterized protein n=1 Tax=Centaurea solstitialis TaxID=347529 RepID=A0AA38T0C4_9ASTR|nr:hypothetical protein OSB04_016135 [Centaurea solstitialis]
MAYTSGLQILMDNLKKLIHGNHHPIFKNHPMILSERPQFQLLYQEFDSIIQTLFTIHEDHRHPHELEKVRKLKKRFKDAAEEAQDIVDLFLHDVYRTTRVSSTSSDVFATFMNLENVMRSIESIKADFMTFNIHDMKMGLSPRIDCVKTQSSSTRNPLGTEKQSAEVIVGFDRDAELIRDKLTEDQKRLDVVSIVGMGGLGKTTLVTKVFNDRFVVYHFHVRAWATISQTYIKREFLTQILASSGVHHDLEEASDFKLREKLHKHLMGKRYLIVIDDIWSIKVWDDLKVFFPHENNGSRILLTSRHNEVALHAKPHGYIHSLPYLTEEQSWELLHQKVFHGDKCPEWLIEPGMQIAKKCHGLPLSVVVMAGILVKEEMNKDLWEKIASSVTSYVVSDEKGILEKLALSYHHLPHHLRECLLYLGGFREDFRFNVKRLTSLWGAEGFIEESGNQSMEDTAMAYLVDLVDRNLLIVSRRKFNGDIAACKLHDLVRELCLEKAKDERFFLTMDRPPLSSQLLERAWKKLRRVFTNQDIYIINFAHPPAPRVRSLLWFHRSTSLINELATHFRSFVLLRVLDIQKCELIDFPEGIALLVHLRYLAIWHSFGFPSSICNLWSLQTLIVKTRYSRMVLPNNISNLVNLRHLWCSKGLLLPTIEKSMNLQAISDIMFGHGVNFGKCFPSIKRLAVTCNRDDENHFELFPYLETMKLRGGFRQNHIWFPATLKKLSLLFCFLPWSAISIIQLLPNLEVLKLKENAFDGAQWNAGEQQFQQLKFLKLVNLNIQHWEVHSSSFPRLRRLTLLCCNNLEEIPLEIGEIITLELIETDSGNNSLVKSVKKIKKEQDEEGNTELKITVDGLELSTTLSEHEEYHFELLPYLETLDFVGLGSRCNHIWFPATLKKLTLKECCLPWSDMSIIQLLPKLEVLKLSRNAFMGTQWDACEQHFRQLKFLQLFDLNIKQWEASSMSFPCLKRLSLFECFHLEAIPLEIGEIATLELIETDRGNNSVVEAVKRIQQEQHDVGNDQLKITVNGMELSLHLSRYEGLESE